MFVGQDIAGKILNAAGTKRVSKVDTGKDREGMEPMTFRI
jgi:hypothetical protein